MKKLNAILGAVITSLLLIGVLFKIMHWPGSSMFLILSVGMLSMYMVPVAIFNIQSYQNKTLIGISNGIGGFGGMILSIGLLFKIMHWPGSSFFMLVGMAFLTVVIFMFMILYIASKETIKLSPGTMFSAICFGLLLYTVSIGSNSKSSLDNLVSTADKINAHTKEITDQNLLLLTTISDQDIISIYNKTNSLTNDIHNIKTELFAQTDALPREIADTISISLISAKDNYDVPTFILGLSDPSNPTKNPDFEDLSALTLKMKIEEFNQVIANYDSKIKLINTTAHYNYQGYDESWETQTFYHYTISQVILTLNQIQLEANIICNTILTHASQQKNPTD